MKDEYAALGREDTGDVAALEARCFSSAWKEEQYAALVEKGVCKLFGVRRDGELIAYIALGAVPGVPELEVYNIAVSEHARRQGVGKKLLALVLAAAARSGIERILLEVREGNAPAIALYEDAGFVARGRRAAYYTKPCEDALLYVYQVPC